MRGLARAMADMMASTCAPSPAAAERSSGSSAVMAEERGPLSASPSAATPAGGGDVGTGDSGCESPESAAVGSSKPALRGNGAEWQRN